MKKKLSRRGVISIAGAATAASISLPLIARNDGRLYGAPTSVTGPQRIDVVSDTLMRLPLTRDDIPKNVWEEFVVASSLWSDVLSNPEEALAFQNSPHDYLSSRGISPDLLNDQNLEVQLLKVVMHPGVQHAAAMQDYETFARYVRDVVGVYPSSKNLTDVLATRIEQHRSEIEQTMQRIAQRSPDISLDATDIGKLRRLKEIMDAPVQGTGLADTVALLNVWVFINFGLVAIAGAFVTLWVLASPFLWISGDSPQSVGLDKALSDRLSSFDKELVNDLDITTKAARLLGQDNFVEKAIKELIMTEATAVTEAMERAGLLTIDQLHRDEALRLVGELYLSSAGFDSESVSMDGRQ